VVNPDTFLTNLVLLMQQRQPVKSADYTLSKGVVFNLHSQDNR